MSFSRRAFLSLAAGVAVTAAMPSRAYENTKRSIAERVQKCTTMHFIDSYGETVGPSFDIPPQWWYVSNGNAVSHPLVVNDWSGPHCRITEIELRNGREKVLRQAITINSSIMPGDTLWVNCLCIEAKQ